MGATLTRAASVEDIRTFAEHADDACHDSINFSYNEYTANLKEKGYWIDLNDARDNARLLAAKVKEIIRRYNLNRNDTYLISGIVSDFYEMNIGELHEEIRFLRQENFRTNAVLDQLQKDSSLMSDDISYLAALCTQSPSVIIQQVTSPNSKKIIQEQLSGNNCKKDFQDSLNVDLDNPETTQIRNIPVVQPSNRENMEDVTICIPNIVVSPNDHQQQLNANASSFVPPTQPPPDQEETHDLLLPPPIVQDLKSNKNKNLPTHRIATGVSIPLEKKDQILDVVFYDIPKKWSPENIVDGLNTLGSLVSATLKTKGKYYTVRADIILNPDALVAWKRGDWQIFINELPVRWFPAEESLEQRRSRDYFMATIENLPPTITESEFFRHHEVRNLYRIKAFKILKSSSPTSPNRLIGWFETYGDLNNAIRSGSFRLISNNENFLVKWERDQNSSPKKRDSNRKILDKGLDRRSAKDYGQTRQQHINYGKKQQYVRSKRKEEKESKRKNKKSNSKGKRLDSSKSKSKKRKKDSSIMSNADDIVKAIVDKVWKKLNKKVTKGKFNVN